MEYNYREIEKKWQGAWKKSGVYKVSNDSPKPKFYVLDMFPYPSGAGLHVGHPLGYIASDIYARYKRLKGFNVLHPMGYDSFGLPAEQYALETGQHPAVTTEKNIETFRQQLDNIGFSFDWSRELRTSDPHYYKWTQWIFLQIFNCWFDKKENKARRIEDLVEIFEQTGNTADNGQRQTQRLFSANQWKDFSDEEKQEVLMEYRLAYSAFGEVNWCEALGTVLANDEVVNGVSERGGHPVVKKKMRQWYMRITDYAERLLGGLEKVDFSDAMKEMQRNWIGRSEGAEIEFSLTPNPSPGGEGSKQSLKIEVYTTRPDTIFGVDFMVLAPEHELVSQITTKEQQPAIDNYLTYVKSRSDRERMAEVKQVTGCFTGAYAVNPFSGKQIPVWIAEYVLAGYGTGAIMAVPCGDQRDFDFAKHFGIPVTNIIGDYFNGQDANPTKEAILTNSGFLDGIQMKDAIAIVNDKIEEIGIGQRKINYKMRDAGFSRQRYWGEPFPIIYKNGVAYPVDLNELPVELPHVEQYSPGPDGQGPLANIREWVNLGGGIQRETNTMPGYAGSSWYFLRYMDPHNDAEFADKKATDYWNQVDVYIGGTEHAVGHLLYSRMWTKVLYDLGYIGFDEPFKKLVNQGMIQGVSQIAYVATNDFEEGVHKSMRNTVTIPNSPPASVPESMLHLYSSEILNDENKHLFKPYNIPVDVVEINTVNSERNMLNIELGQKLYSQRLSAIYIKSKTYYYKGNWRSWNEENNSWEIIEAQPFFTASMSEKMSKSKYNVVNPESLIDKYGADTFRMYEMFLGPVEQSKPWDTKGIEGVHRFLKKLWRLFFDEVKGPIWTTLAPSPSERAGGEVSPEELKVLHKAIKKIGEDTERFSYNTAVSAFMVCVNELHDLKCYKKEILEPLLILLAPYAPHIAEELFHQLGNTTSVIDAHYPKFESKYLVESEQEYPVSINGKMRTTIIMSADVQPAEAERIALANEVVNKWIEGKPVKKVIFVKGKMVNVVV
ncbi:MAG: class I tRNA ligase family protein [Ginsengibacter sp.]